MYNDEKRKLSTYQKISEILSKACSKGTNLPDPQLKSYIHDAGQLFAECLPQLHECQIKKALIMAARENILFYTLKSKQKTDYPDYLATLFLLKINNSMHKELERSEAELKNAYSESFELTEKMIGNYLNNLGSWFQKSIINANDPHLSSLLHHYANENNNNKYYTGDINAEKLLAWVINFHKPTINKMESEIASISQEMNGRREINGTYIEDCKTASISSRKGWCETHYKRKEDLLMTKERMLEERKNTFQGVYDKMKNDLLNEFANCANEMENLIKMGAFFEFPGANYDNYDHYDPLNQYDL